MTLTRNTRRVPSGRTRCSATRKSSSLSSCFFRPRANDSNATATRPSSSRRSDRRWRLRAASNTRTAAHFDSAQCGRNRALPGRSQPSRASGNTSIPARRLLRHRQTPIESRSHTRRSRGERSSSTTNRPFSPTHRASSSTSATGRTQRTAIRACPSDSLQLRSPPTALAAMAPSTATTRFERFAPGRGGKPSLENATGHTRTMRSRSKRNSHRPSMSDSRRASRCRLYPDPTS